MTDSSGSLIVSPLTSSSVVKAQLQDNAGNGITSTTGALDVNLKTSSITLPISAASLPLPAGASTSALQTSGNTTLTTISTTLGSILLDLTNGTQITQITGTVPLPTGSATAANQTNVQSAPGTSATTAITVQGSATGTALPVSAASLPLPTGAATSANQTTANTSLASIVTNTTGLATAANQTNGTQVAKLAGKAAIGHARNDYTSTSVTTSAYVQLVASTAAAVSEIFIFDSSGQTLVLATGGVGSEVDQIYICPGGNGTVPLAIAASTRISIKAVSATANQGEIDLNLLG